MVIRILDADPPAQGVKIARRITLGDDNMKRMVNGVFAATGPVNGGDKLMGKQAGGAAVDLPPDQGSGMRAAA